jgi:hypothetical protein
MTKALIRRNVFVLIGMVELYSTTQNISREFWISDAGRGAYAIASSYPTASRILGCGTAVIAVNQA